MVVVPQHWSGAAPRFLRLPVLLATGLMAMGTLAQPVFYYSLPITSSTNWANYSVPMVETAGWSVGSPSGPPPTVSQFQAMLSSLRALTLQFSGSNLLVFLDNVALPGTVTSTFDGCSDEGWTAPTGMSSSCDFGNPASSISTGGFPTLNFEAPGKFLGDQSSAYGGNLSFDANTGLYSSVVTNGTVILVQAAQPSAAGPSTPVEWGYYDFGLGVVPPGVTNLAQVSAGFRHVVALQTDRTPVAWGDNSFGQTDVPPGLTNLGAVAAGFGHSLALQGDGTVVTWGRASAVPAGLSNVVALAAGYEYSLALKREGTVVGWGNGYRTGITNLPILTNIVAIAAQDESAWPPSNLALRRDGTLIAWSIGFTESGSNVVNVATNLPAGLTNITAIAAGDRHFLAVKANGTVVAWGYDGSGQTNVPTGLSNVVAVSAGFGFSQALRGDGTVVGWGDNTYNETNIPGGLTNVVGISAGGYQCVALIGLGPPVQQVPLTSPQWANGVFSVSVPTQNGRVYSLEYKNSLVDPQWSALPLAAGTGGMLVLSDAAATPDQRFYRVRRW